MRRPRTRTARSPTSSTISAPGKPMDRLVCGDVGFGKTEVALRAAFIAAMAGHAGRADRPTTLLARQHYNNFSERFQGFPIEIGRLSRLVPAREAKATREGLKAGKVDIVIGTHAHPRQERRVQEARPGHRRRGAALRRHPQGAAEGAARRRPRADPDRDADPAHAADGDVGPARAVASSRPRRSTGSRCAPTSCPGTRWWSARRCCANIIAAARASSSCRASPTCPTSRNSCARRCPRSRYVVAHGQMAPTEVEERMRAFYDRKYDVLLSTTIVESGLDIPSRQHPDRPPRRPLRPRPALPAARPRRPGQDPRLCLFHHAGRPAADRDRRQAPAGARRPRYRSAPASSSPATISTSAAPAICSATSSRAISGRSASSSTSRCSRRRSSRPRRAALEARPDDFSPQITVDAPILIPEDYVPDLDLRMGLYRRMNELETRRRDRALRRRDDRPLRQAARRDRRTCSRSSRSS